MADVKLTKNERWALEEASKPGGFMPNEAFVVGLLKRLEREGLLASVQDFVWHATRAGRLALSKAGGNNG